MSELAPTVAGVVGSVSAEPSPPPPPPPLLSPPLDLTHHFSATTKRRVGSDAKKLDRLFSSPGIVDLAQGSPHYRLSPFDTLEGRVALPDRWVPTPNGPPPPAEADSDINRPSLEATLPFSLPPPSPPSSSTPPSSPQPTTHITIPETSAPGTDPHRAVDLASALRYGQAPGYPPLLSFVRQFVREHLHPAVPYAGGPDIIMTNGSTDGFAKTLELLADGWVDGRDPVAARESLLVEPWVYHNARNQIISRGLVLAPVEADGCGMLVHGRGGLEAVLAGWDTRTGKRPRILYSVSMGHNPTGLLIPVERRREIYAVCSKYDIIIVEDDPYWHMQFPSAAAQEAASRNLEPPAAPTTTTTTTPVAVSSADSPVSPPPSFPSPSSGYDFLDSLVPSFLSLDTDGRVIRLDTFSKSIAPGCRVGWITAQPAFIERLMRITETYAQQPSGFAQSAIAALLLGTQPPATTSLFARLPLVRQASFAGWSVDGWVRWLAGLRGAHERRMARACRILDAHAYQLKQGTPVNRELADWGVVTRTRLLSFSWPRAGMFIWLRVHFEQHPLWMARRRRRVDAAAAVVDGPVLNLALFFYLLKKPWQVLVSPGGVFAASDAIQRRHAWKHYRISFAVLDEDAIDSDTLKFVQGIHRFWRLKDVNDIEDLIEEADLAGVSGTSSSDGTVNMGPWIGC